MKDRPEEQPVNGAADESAAFADGSAEAEGADAPATLADEDSRGGELDEMRDRYLRVMAEFDNFRKRTDRERSEGGVRAQSQLVERLLDPLDDLQRVAQFNADTTTVDALLEGVRMVERKLLRVLETSGLEVVDARGQAFDPSIHEALMTAPAESAEDDDTVGEVFQTGYQFKGILLRPARVQVRKYGD